MPRRTAGRTKNRRSRIFILSSAPSRAGVEGWPGAWKRSLGLADFAGLLAWRAVPTPFMVISRGQCGGLPVAPPAILARSLAGSRGVSDAPQWPQLYLVPPYSRAAATAFSR